MSMIKSLELKLTFVVHIIIVYYYIITYIISIIIIYYRKDNATAERLQPDSFTKAWRAEFLSNIPRVCRD